MKSIHIAPLAQAPANRDPGAPGQHHWQRVGPHPEAQQCMHAASTERLHHQRTRMPQSYRTYVQSVASSDGPVHNLGYGSPCVFYGARRCGKNLRFTLFELSVNKLC